MRFNMMNSNVNKFFAGNSAFELRSSKNFKQKLMQTEEQSIDEDPVIFHRLRDSERETIHQKSGIKIPLKCQIISYGHEQFQRILDLDKISNEMLLESLDITMNRDKVFGAGEGAGQSGSFFFFSHDQRFIIKTLRGKEKTNFMSMIRNYIAHIINSDN